jgi:hypothetical protein
MLTDCGGEYHVQEENLKKNKMSPVVPGGVPVHTGAMGGQLGTFAATIAVPNFVPSLVQNW